MILAALLIRSITGTLYLLSVIFALLAFSRKPGIMAGGVKDALHFH
jgi:hypothetical protein